MILRILTLLIHLHVSTSVSFYKCGYTPHRFGISSINLSPSTVKAGSPLHIAFTFNPPKPYFWVHASLTLEIKSNGIVLETVNYDLCKVGKCPITNHEQSIVVTYDVQEELKNNAISFYAHFVNEINHDSDCVAFDVTPASIKQSSTLVSLSTVTGQFPQLIFGPTANLPSVVATQTVNLVSETAGTQLGPQGWVQTRAMVQKTSGTLHLRSMVIAQMSSTQHVALVAGANKLGLKLSLEAGGALCGVGSGNTTAQHWFKGAGKDFMEAGGGKLLTLWGMESVFSKTKRKCPDQTVEETASELASYAGVVQQILGYDVQLYLYDCIAHYIVEEWPANWPMPPNVTYDMNLDHVLTTLKKKMKLQGAVLVGYWADCPYSCSTKYNAKNGTQLDGYLRFAAAVALVKSKGLKIGKTFNAHPGTSEGFYNETMLDWTQLAKVVPSVTSKGFGLDLIAVETWYEYPTEAAPETEQYTTAFTAKAVFDACCQ